MVLASVGTALRPEREEGVPNAGRLSHAATGSEKVLVRSAALIQRKEAHRRVEFVLGSTVAVDAAALLL